MKKALCMLFFFSMLCPLLLSAQREKVDVIYLKNDSFLIGKILEQQPDQSYKLQLADSSIVIVFKSKVLTVTRNVDAVITGSAKPAYQTMGRRKIENIGFEATLSYILLGDSRDPSFKFDKFKSVNGFGITLLPEIKTESPFSLLPGVAIQYYTISNWAYIREDRFDLGTIDNGYQIRLELPIRFRYTLGTKLRYFFQLGFSPAGDFYRGSGSNSSLGGISGGSYTNYGWQHYNTVSVNMLMLGAGIRKRISPGIEFLSYIEGSPLNYQFANGHYWQPFGQVHLGFNFGTKVP